MPHLHRCDGGHRDRRLSDRPGLLRAHDCRCSRRLFPFYDGEHAFERDVVFSFLTFHRLDGRSFGFSDLPSGLGRRQLSAHSFELERMLGRLEASQGCARISTRHALRDATPGEAMNRRGAPLSRHIGILQGRRT